VAGGVALGIGAGVLIHKLMLKTAQSREASHGDKVKAVRAREQPIHAFHMNHILACDDQMHEGVADGVKVHKIEPCSAGAAWCGWRDERNGVDRGGAVVYVPEKDARTDVCALFVHGGSFEGYSPELGGYDRFASRIAAETRMVVVCPDHPLSGDGRSMKAPAIVSGLVEDALALITHDPLTSKARTTPANIIILGDSSGATQATSVLFELARKHEASLSNVRGVVLLSPWWDLTCSGLTYISNAFSEDAHTGDLPFRLAPDENRADFRSYALRYVGSADLLKSAVYSPYWLSRGADPDLLAKLEKARVPMWACIGAAETLMGEVLDFAEKLQGKFPMEVWLHEGMFHDWPVYTSEEGFPSKDAAYKNIVSFMERVSGSSIVLNDGIHYHIDPW